MRRVVLNEHSKMPLALKGARLAYLVVQDCCLLDSAVQCMNDKTTWDSVMQTNPSDLGLKDLAPRPLSSMVSTKFSSPHVPQEQLPRISTLRGPTHAHRNVHHLSSDSPLLFLSSCANLTTSSAAISMRWSPKISTQTPRPAVTSPLKTHPRHHPRETSLSTSSLAFSISVA